MNSGESIGIFDSGLPSITKHKKYGVLINSHHSIHHLIITASVFNLHKMLNEN